MQGFIAWIECNEETFVRDTKGGFIVEGMTEHIFDVKQ